jgi:cysteine synthase
MSRERFEWLERWVADPGDVIRTPGTESNVREIYAKCAELAAEPQNVIFNQFSEFGNHLIHFLCTGRAVEAVFESLRARQPSLRLRGFVSATGSAGTLGAGDFLKERHGSQNVAVEPLECPTMLYNGYGEHNIQGIGDKHIPLIHNVTNSDVVTAVSDRATDRLGVLFNTTEGRRYMASRQVPQATLDGLSSFGLSSICNIVASIKVAKHFGLGHDDVLATIATDGFAMYGSERAKALARHYPEGFDEAAAAATFGEHVLEATDDHLLELSTVDRDRVFNLGYFTWVEQQGILLEDFERRRPQSFWRALRDLLPVWDAMIQEFNERSGVLARL